MINGYALVGRIAYIGEDHIILSVVRSNKNSEGEYETDKFNIYMSNSIVTSTKNYNKIGDIICVKGHMQSIEYEVDGKMYRKLKLLADKVTFLSSASNSSGSLKSIEDIEEEDYADCDE